MLTLWDPFFPVKSKSDSKLSTKSYFDRLFEDTFDSAFHDLFNVRANYGMESKKNEDGSLTLSVDVPGIKESDLVIELSDGVLTIKGERKTATSSYSLHKSLSVPESYDADNMVAELKDGVLSLKLASKPLPPSKEVKKIPILSSK